MRRKYYPDGDGLYLVLYPPRADEPPKERGPQPKNRRPTKLTDVRVRNLAKDRKSAYWVYRYMLGRKQHDMGLGPYPEITLKRAREKALQARMLKVEQVDPLEHRESLRVAKRLESAHSKTFRECAYSYIDANKPSWRNEKHAKQWAATLERYAMPIIDDIPVASVDVSMVHKILEPIWATKTDTAANIRGRIEAVLDWAKARGFRQGENPARWKGHIQNLFPAPSKVRKVKHHAALPYVELPRFMIQLTEQEGNGAFALRFVILTAARTSEVIGATWAEIDFDKSLWTIPAERMKGNRNHRVPLSKPALSLLRQMRQTTGGNGFVFPGRKPGRPLSNMAMLTTLRRMERNDLTVHGFRSTFKDWAAERSNFPNEVSEAALAHVVGDKVEAAYRRGDLFEKRRKLMNAWGNYCGSGASEDAKVVPLRKAAN